MPARGWKDQELEAFLAWLEDNQQLLRGSSTLWATKAKEALFADNEDVDVKKIKSNFHNMKNCKEDAGAVWFWREGRSLL
jgi:hypothetical protein